MRGADTWINTQRSVALAGVEERSGYQVTFSCNKVIFRPGTVAGESHAKIISFPLGYRLSIRQLNFKDDFNLR